MPILKFTKGSEVHSFNLRDYKTDAHALKIGAYYVDLTQNQNLSSFTKVKFYIDGAFHYLRDKYFNSNNQHSGNFTNKAYKPSRPVTHTINVAVENYSKYKIALNGNFDVLGWFDQNNTSYHIGSYFEGNFSDTVQATDTQGHRNPGYTVKEVTDPMDLELTLVPQTMNGEIEISGNISDLTSEDKEIFYRKMTNTRNAAFVFFNIKAKVIDSELIVTYGWGCGGYDERCNANVSYSIKIGVITYE